MAPPFGDTLGRVAEPIRENSPPRLRRIVTDAEWRIDGREQPITPGMAVTAESKTGRRRVIDYLLAP